MADKKKPTREDANQRAFRTLQEITGEAPKTEPEAKPEKNEAAVSLGSKGGKARARNLTPEQKTVLARKAASVRWAKNKQSRP